MGLLDGKVAIVTGSGGGIGRAEALALARGGARVVVNDVGSARDGSGQNAGPAETVANEIRAAGGQAVHNTDSVADAAGAERIVKTAIDTFGRLDVLVNNAGILRDKTLAKMTDEMFDSVIAVHLRGTFLCTRAAARVMIDRGEGGAIINTTSVSGLMGNFGQANYAAAKAGIYGLTRTAHLELHGKARIRVNAVAPVALTRMTEDIPMVQAIPDAKEALAPEHVANVVVFLASDLSAELSGVIVGVQGPQVSVYRMTQTDGVAPRARTWSAQELRERWKEIARE
jgi:NAD(P)-dependent dehydrogenase (short-subunit alcohol dehydrogenase family)